MFSNRTSLLLGIGAGATLTAAGIAVKNTASSPSALVSLKDGDSSPSLPDATSILDILAHPEHFYGKTVEVEGKIISEIDLEFRQITGSEWWPVYDSKTGLSKLTKLDFVEPNPVGYWYLLAEPMNTTSPILVFSPYFNEAVSNPDSDVIRFSAQVKIQMNGEPFLSSLAFPGEGNREAPFEEALDVSSRQGYVEKEKRISPTTEAPLVGIDDVLHNQDAWNGIGITIMGSIKFLGIEPGMSASLHGLECFRGAESLDLLDENGTPLDGDPAEKTDWDSFMHSRRIIPRSWWYELSAEDSGQKILVRSLNEKLPLNVNCIQGIIIKEERGAIKDDAPYIELLKFGTK